MQVVGRGLNGQEVLLQRQIQGRGLGAHPLPLFLGQTEAQRAKKNVLETAPNPRPLYLRISRSGSGAHRSQGKSMAPAS